MNNTSLIVLSLLARNPLTPAENRNRRIVSSVNVRRKVDPAQTPNGWANWTIAHDANGVAFWAFGYSAPERFPVRARAFRDGTENQFEMFWMPNVAEGIRDPRGASRPPRSVASALREQARKRIWNENQKAARRAAADANQMMLFA